MKSNHPEKTAHPCQFPVELAERCVLALSNEGDKILDPFCGVGSTIIAAIKNNRQAIGVDISSEYIDIAQNQIDKFLNGVLKPRAIGTPIHVPKGTEKASKVPTKWKKQKISQ